MKIKITLTALIFSIYSYSQCKSGDCDNGTGLYQFEDGVYFQGEFKNGEYIKGKLHYLNGDIYEGTFLNKKLNGPNCEWNTNNQTRSGTFKEGKLISGIIEQKNVEQTDRWEGTFNENTKLIGEGTFTRNSNIKGKYIRKGNFNNGVLNDKNGYILYYDKRYYEGEVKDNLPNGEGKMTFPNDNIQEGIFLDGQFQRGLNLQKSLDDNSLVIPLEYDSSHRVYYIYIEIGGTKIKTVFDTGASFLSIDKEYLYSAKKQNLVSEISKITTSDANNNKTSNDLYLLENLNVLTKNDKMLSIPFVPAIGKSEGKPSLFGVGALKQLGSKFIVDFENNQINIIK